MAGTGICFLIEGYCPIVGGTQTQTRLLADNLVARGFKVTVVTRRSEASFPAEEIVGGARVVRVAPAGDGQRKRWWMLFTVTPKLLALHREYNVIFVTGFRTIGVSAVIACMLAGKKCVLRAVSAGEMSGEFFGPGLVRMGLKTTSLPIRALLAIRNAFLKRADAFIAQSSEIARELASCGVLPERVRIIPNGVDTGIFHPVMQPDKAELRKKLNLPADRLLVIYTGRIVTYKGLPLLLKVWKEIAELRADADLLLAGSESNDLCDCMVELREFVDKNGLRDRVRFLGSVPNVDEYLKASDVFVLPTENEVFSNSAIEAMACGLPVVCTPVGGFKDVVKHGVNGMIVEVGDHRGLSNALECLLGNAALRKSLGDAALATVQERYSKQIVALAYARLFDELATAK
ncbi:MAG: glycosyltransferase family 4 protein [bacterium]